MKKYQPDVFFSPDGFCSLRSDIKTVVLVHDIAYQHFPDQVSFFIRKFYQNFQHRYLQKAAQVITVSHFVKNDLVDKIGLSAKKIHVAHNGCSSNFSPASDLTKKEIKEKYTNGQPYFFYVGAVHPRKNVHGLITAFDIFKEKGAIVKLLELEKIPHDWFFPEMYAADTQAKSIASIQEEYFFPAEKLLFVAPEYNGSFPGVFKSFIDAVEPDVWKGKKIGLVGVSTGRAGNSRGMDHLTDVFHHLRAEVFSDKVPISNVSEMVNTKGDLTDAATLAVLKRQATGFLSF